jgi:ribosomal protein S18 acetylase RimI-like enzyme
MAILVNPNVQTQAPAIPGLALRGFQGPSDYPKMVAAIASAKLADGTERSDTVEQVANTYAHLHHCDPTTDMCFAELDGEVLGYSRVWWEVNNTPQFIGFQVAFVKGEWRGRGIGSALLYFNEQRLGQIAAQLKASGELPPELPCVAEIFTTETACDTIALAERRGYQPVRHTYDMLRPDLENIPDLPLPPGLEVRPYQPGHLRQIWEASNEAFRDHWSYIPDPWEEYEKVQAGPDFDPGLWRVAWAGDQVAGYQVAGMVLSFIDQAQNEEYGRLRGYTENICVRRPWRGQGLAKALIALSLHALKERGMTEAALGADAQNTSGATHLYEKMGYRVVKHGTIYRKEI